MTLLRNALSVSVLTVLTSTLSAQQTFEPGYLIDSSGRRSEVLILNRDWRYHPAEIEVMRGQDTDAARIVTESLEEFGIDGKARYVNREIEIERSSIEGPKPPDTIPVPRRERVLLRVEVEGEASLYSYLAPRVSKYFLSVGKGEPTALTYTRTLQDDGQIAEGRTYIRQLAVRLRCGDGVHVSKRLRYTTRELRQVVMAYNDCAGGSEGVTSENTKPGFKKFHISVQPGWYRTRLLLKFTDERENYVGMGVQTAFRPALDLEFILPSGNNKYAINLRPSYYRYAGTGTKLVRDREVTLSVEYSAIDVPLGFRYYSFINPKLKAFGTASVGFTFLSGGEVRQQPQQPLQMKGMFSLTAEVGLRYRDRWGISLAYEDDSSSLRNIRTSSNTSGTRFMLSYTLY